MPRSGTVEADGEVDADHFTFLSERVQAHNGFILKTVGDAVMAAFHDPADALGAVLAIQDEVADFNRRRGRAAHVHCIAVTIGDTLDYFGAVNTASRLEHQCRGGEVKSAKRSPGARSRRIRQCCAALSKRCIS